MSKRAPNAAIGEVECPHRGCSKICKVFKFRQRTEGRTSVFSGKYYADCPAHGRQGADGNAAITEYILEHGRMFGPGEGRKAPDQAPEKNGAPAPSQAPPPAREEPKASPWRTLLG